MTVGSSSPTTSGSITPSNAGDSLICFAVGRGTGTFTGCTNSAGSTVISDGSSTHLALFRVASCIATAQTFSPSFTGFSGVYSAVWEISNLGNFDQIATENTGSGVSVTTNFITPTYNNELLIAFALTGSGSATFSDWLNDFTQENSNTSGPSMASAYLVQTSGPTSIQSGVTLSTSESWTAMFAAYAPINPPAVTAPYMPYGLQPILAQ